MVLPGASYSPDHGVGLSGALLRYFRFRGGARPSRLSTTVGLSSDGEVELNVDPELWLRGDRVVVVGASKVSYARQSFFGIGNDTAEDREEDYAAFRVDGRLECHRRIAPNLYVGPLIDARYEDILEVEAGGLLATGAIPGATGGTLVGLGGTLRWDTRDNSFAPEHGWQLSVSPRLYDPAFGSDARFTRLTFDGSVFFRPWRDHVIAFDGRVDLHGGDPPFDALAMAGGRRLLRGMLEGRFRDRHLIAAQVEYRAPLWWRLGVVGFAGLGRVAARVADFDRHALKYSLGGGLRYVIDPVERIHLRVDVGFTNTEVGAYLNLLEAF